MKVLLVEDEPGLVMTLQDLLASEGYQVDAVADGEKCLRLASSQHFDILILDVMLPGEDGFRVCRRLRQKNVQAPILMLTARSQVADKVKGLKIGADDYLTKPFETTELLARMEALLRRTWNGAQEPQEKHFEFGSVKVDFEKIEVRQQGKLVQLSAREFELLKYFINNRGATLSRAQLLRDVWGYKGAIFTRTVDVHVSSLRQKLEERPRCPEHFHTIRGFGYRFSQ